MDTVLVMWLLMRAETGSLSRSGYLPALHSDGRALPRVPMTNLSAVSSDRHIMSRHQPDLLLCRRQTGASPGLLCERCDGRCVLCDSFVHPVRPVRICDDCAYGANATRCIICGHPGVAPASYCRECVALERDRDGCARVVNVGRQRTDAVYERKKHATAVQGLR